MVDSIAFLVVNTIHYGLGLRRKGQEDPFAHYTWTSYHDLEWNVLFAHILNVPQWALEG